MNRARLALSVFALLGWFTLAGPSAEAQTAAKVPRVGFLASSSAERDQSRLAAFQRGLRDLGYPERGIAIEQRYAAGAFAALPGLAAELVRLEVDVILTEGTPAAQAARNATNVIPIVMGNAGNPVGSGLVTSLSRPGGNVTGLSDFSADLMSKRLGLLKELAPSLARLAVLLNPANPTNPIEFKAIQAAGKPLGISARPYEIRGPEDVAPVQARIRKQMPDAVVVAGDPLLGLQSKRIIEFALSHRLPGIYPAKAWPEAGGLMSYGTDFEDLFRRAAAYVDKILKGARPQDLPVEQPTKFELVVNLKTAKAIGLALPQSLLLRADRVIE